METEPPETETDVPPVTETAPKDRLGRSFDPEVFRSNPDGTPNLNKRGEFMPRGGRKPSTPSPSVPDPKVDFSDVDAASRAVPTVEEVEKKYHEVAANPTAETVISLIQMCFILIGEEEGILTESQKLLLRKPLERILQKYNVRPDLLPAEMDFALAILAVFIEKLKEGKKTAAWFVRARTWVLQKWFNRQGRQLARDLKNVTPEAP